MKQQSITFKAERNSGMLTVTKLVNTLRFGVGQLVTAAEVKKLISSAAAPKVIIV